MTFIYIYIHVIIYIYQFRRLSNRESAARSKERKALHQFELEVKVERLETQIDTLTAVLKLEKVITILLVTVCSCVRDIFVN